ncbi:phosphoglycerate mutase [Marmoricola endophyticus]|uniref:Phosphoglycerate mutase n=1 Tax=Marmoricola endophyticus TaxID=2040280 RepID=A0A917BIU2_9ACTN|nr:histidine phosphatase family protein [Marmoricola endophyticus]GGF45233.1 phosphoglycerate mutase [Marmoricola endophyticus]
MSAPGTTVHLVRHGEVYNPHGVLYGRAPGYRLSRRGEAMADRVGEALATRDVVAVTASPLERAQQTAGPLAALLGLEIGTDERIIESENFFEGARFTIRRGLLLNPQAWPKLWNPFRPSWGEAYDEVAARMWAAVLDARAAAEGHEAVLVSHQLPVWVCRLHAEGRRLWHDPRSRQCTLCSVTSVVFGGEDGTDVVAVGYAEPAADLIPVADRRANFSSGGAGEMLPGVAPGSEQEEAAEAEVDGPR